MLVLLVPCTLSFWDSSGLDFPRDGTSRGMSWDNPGWDILLSLCPETKIFPCPAVPAQTPLSQDVLGKNHFPPPKKHKKQEKDVLKQEIIGKKLVIVPSRPVQHPKFWQKTNDCPFPDFDRMSRPVPSRVKILSLSHCPWRNFCPFVLNCCTIVLSETLIWAKPNLFGTGQTTKVSSYTKV